MKAISCLIVSITVLLMAVSLSPSVHAEAFSYDESTGGDIVSSASAPDWAPVTFVFGVGTNTVTGRFGTGTAGSFEYLRDQDYFRFTVPAGARLQSIRFSWASPEYFGSLPSGGIGSVRLFNSGLDAIVAEVLPFIDVYANPSGAMNFFEGDLLMASGTYAWSHGFYRGASLVGGGFEVDYELTFVIAAADVPTLIADLIEDVIALNLDAGISNAVDSKLQNALDALDRSEAGDSYSAIGILYALINSVEAQRGKKLTDAQADELIAVTQVIIDAVSQP